MNSSENWLIGRLATNPRLIHSVPIEPEWFGDEHTRSLVKLMVKLDGDWLGEMDLARKFEAENQQAAQHTDWLSIDQSQNFSYPMESVVSTLKKQYTVGMAQRAANRFAHDATDENAKQLAVAIAEMNESGYQSKGEQLSDLMGQYIQEVQQPKKADRLIKTMPKVNSLLGGGLTGGQLIIIGARPSTGKSAFIVNMIDGIQRNTKNMVIDLYSLEMANSETRNRFIALTSRVPLGAIKYYRLDPDQQNKVIGAAQLLDNSNIEITDNAHKLSDISRAIRERAAKAQKGHYVAFVDYLGLIEPDVPSGSRYQDVTHITRAFKVLANELDVPIVLLSQLNRENARNNRAPELYDLRDSGSIEQDANVVIFLYRVDDPDEETSKRQVMVKVAKNRDGELKSAQFDFLPAVMLFKEP